MKHARIWGIVLLASGASATAWAALSPIRMPQSRELVFAIRKARGRAAWPKTSWKYCRSRYT